jgi:hypothetical protein
MTYDSSRYWTYDILRYYLFAYLSKVYCIHTESLPVDDQYAELPGTGTRYHRYHVLVSMMQAAKLMKL